VRVVLLFLDGVGLGRKNPEVNPFFVASLPRLRNLLGEIPHLGKKRLSTSRAILAPANATLGVAGLPQSGTGQTAIFTGENAAKKIGRHFGPFPTTDLRPVLEQKNIFRQLKEHGKSVFFANAFPKQFFDYTNSGTRRLTVTTLSCMMASVPLQTNEALQRNEAVSADITRVRWPELGYPELPAITTAEAGRHLAALSAKHDFVLFEYWLTDHAGHSREMKFAVDTLERFDEFLGGLVDGVDLKSTLIVLISDHGNIEDLSTKGHTRNPVPCIGIGAGRKEFVASIKTIANITPAIVDVLTQ
jgi:2,3-bisphosphoglycerate-independent phosphoglycerate mutase